MIKYIGKTLLIEEEDKKILVIGDLHLSFDGEGLGNVLSAEVFEQSIKDFDEIFKEIGKIDKIVLLGDLKNRFGDLERNEREDLVNLFDYLEKKCNEIIIIKGNHDTFISGIAGKRNIDVIECYIFDKYCFLHGDKDFPQMYDKEVKCWIMGHLHPAIKLREGDKTEKYKCFLSGKYKGKKVVILPSFSG